MTNMTNAEAIEHLKDILDDVPNDKCIDWIEALNKAIEVLRQEPCEDAISRAKALEMLGDEPENWTDTEREIQEVNDYRWFKSILEDLPPVTPQPKIGHWVRHKENCCYNKCSICEYEHCKESNYCPNCGAKMKEVEE